MNDSFTETTSQSWGSRLGNSIKGIVVGLVLFAIAFPLLWWNEGRAVDRIKTLKEGQGAVVSASAEQLDPATEGKLVHMTAEATTEETLTDSAFAVSAPALKLIRKVEMYQWDEDEKREKKKKMGGSEETVTTYTYSKEWSSRLIKSSNFKKPDGHTNPSSMPYQSTTRQAGKVDFGAYLLNQGQVGSIRGAEPLSPTQETLQALPPDLAGKTTLAGGGLYVGANSSSPTVGDLRIHFSQVPPATVSILAQQIGNTFQPFKTSTGTLEDLRMGVISAEGMFAQLKKENTMLTWGIRLGGTLLMFLGLTMILKPLSVLGDVVPLIGNVIGAGTALVSGIVAISFSLITIAIAWIVYRPLLGIALLVVALGGIFGLKKLAANKGAPAAAPAAPLPPPPPPPA